MSDEIFENQIVPMELAYYPPDEAASPEMMRFRRTNQFFLVALDETSVHGFINGTLSKGESLDHDSMSNHDPGGDLLCIHSVVVAESHRRKGIASKMLLEYLMHIGECEVRKVALLSKAALIPLYKGVGFINKGPSSVQHGKDVWYQLEMDMRGFATVSFENAFVSVGKSFSGNPAAVVQLPFRSSILTNWPFSTDFQNRFDKWMSNIAAQLNLPATAFVFGGANDEYSIRFFTPRGEISLCGHAAFAAAGYLFRCTNSEVLVLHAPSRVVMAKATHRNVTISLGCNDPSPVTDKTVLHSLSKLSLDTVVAVESTTSFLLVEVSSQETMDSIMLKQVEELMEMYSIVAFTCIPNPSSALQYVCRCFTGGIEDSFCGAAQTMLGPYWYRIYGNIPMRMSQNSTRTGEATVKKDESFVYLTGESEQLSCGKLFSSPFSS